MYKNISFTYHLLTTGPTIVHISFTTDFFTSKFIAIVIFFTVDYIMRYDVVQEMTV